MNCHQVRNLIDGLPTPRFAAPRPGDVRRHFENCPDCREARVALETLEQELRRLPVPKPPRPIGHAVLTRIIEGTAEPQSMADARQARPRRAEAWSWALMLAGMVLGVGAGAYQVLANTPGELLPAPVGETLALTGSNLQLLLGAGVLLYLSGLVGWIEGDSAYED